MLKHWKKLGIPDVENRQTGRSTARVFHILGDCLESPEQWVIILDHYRTHVADKNLKTMIQKTIKDLDLQGFHFNGLTVKFSLKE